MNPLIFLNVHYECMSAVDLWGLISFLAIFLNLFISSDRILFLFLVYGESLVLSTYNILPCTIIFSDNLSAPFSLSPPMIFITTHLLIHTMGS